MKFSVALLSLVICLCVWQQALALPSFSRQHQQSCSHCHNNLPRLNKQGWQYLLNGYAWQDEKKKHQSLFALSSFRLQASAIQAKELDGDFTTPQVRVPALLNYYAMGKIHKQISAVVEFDYDRREEDALRLKRAAVDVVSLYKVHDFTLRIGLFDPAYLLPYALNRSNLVSIKADVDDTVYPQQQNHIGAFPLAFGEKMLAMTRGPIYQGQTGYAVVPGQRAYFGASAKEGISLWGKAPAPYSLVNYQIGLLQDEQAASGSSRVDYYMAVGFRLNTLNDLDIAASLFRYEADQALLAMIINNGQQLFPTKPADVIQSGLALHVGWRQLDLFLAMVLDELDQPEFSDAVAQQAQWQTTAVALSTEVEWRFDDHWLFSARYDSMRPGGLERLPVALDSQQTKLTIPVSILALGGKYYFNDHLAVGGSYYMNRTESQALPSYFGAGQHWFSQTRDLAVLYMDFSF